MTDDDRHTERIDDRPPLVRSWRYGRLAPFRRFLVRWSSWREYRWQARRGRGFFVRGYRGWADYDTWGLDHHLAWILKDALRYMAEHKNGVPGSFVEYDAEGNTVDLDRDSDRWVEWLRDKAEWFAWYWRDDDCLHLYLDVGEPTEEQRSECARAHLAKAEQFRSVVLPDFIKHFEGLWD